MFLYFSLFLAAWKVAEEKRDIMWEGVGCARVTRPALWPHDVVHVEAERLDSTGVGKRRSKK
jgi:hypothetical protein